MLNDLNIPMEETSKDIEEHDTPIDLDNTRIVPSMDVHCTVLEGEAAGAGGGKRRTADLMNLEGYDAFQCKTSRMDA